MSSSTADASVENFGWPCYEGNEVQDKYKADLQIATFDLCQRLYAEGPGTVTAPRFTYAHGRALFPGDRCPTAGASSRRASPSGSMGLTPVGSGARSS